MESESSPEKLAAALRRYALERHRYVTLLARSLGMTRVDFDALDYLQEAGELTPAALARNLCLTTGSVTALIDRLERAGFVTRVRHPSDRRSVLVRQSRKSQEAGRRALTPFVKGVMSAGGRMTARERAAAIKFLEGASEAASVEP